MIGKGNHPKIGGLYIAFGNGDSLHDLLCVLMYISMLKSYCIFIWVCVCACILNIIKAFNLLPWVSFLTRDHFANLSPVSQKIPFNPYHPKTIT